MMSIRNNGSVSKDLEGNFTLKVFQRVYGLTLWVVATFESGRPVLAKIDVPFDPTDERRFPPTEGAVELMEASFSAVERPSRARLRRRAEGAPLTASRL
jgi:hypothetical protein